MDTEITLVGVQKADCLVRLDKSGGKLSFACWLGSGSWGSGGWSSSGGG